MAALPDHVAKVKAAARDAGREVRVIINPMVILAETDEAASDYAEAIIAHSVTEGGVFGHIKSDAHAWAKRKDYDTPRQRALGGGNLQIIGGPDQVADSIARLAQAGIDGVQLSFFDFAPDLALFGARVLPLLKARGLRL
jgi:FMNH2-dependent dimethyl sulfone monooxygenase